MRIILFDFHGKEVHHTATEGTITARPPKVVLWKRRCFILKSHTPEECLYCEDAVLQIIDTDPRFTTFGGPRWGWLVRAWVQCPNRDVADEICDTITKVGDDHQCLANAARQRVLMQPGELPDTVSFPRKAPEAPKE
jgi:hypothetical protein